jgi:glycosyltransferase involved in cell wall biosynthesis
MTKRIKYTIAHYANLERLSDRSFIATNNDPCIFIKLDIDKHILEEKDTHVRMICAVESEHDRITSEVYLPEAGTYSQENAITRSFYWGESQEYIIYRDHSEGVIRYDPDLRPGSIKIRYLAFFIWTSKASKISLARDYARRMHDPTKRSGHSQKLLYPDHLAKHEFELAYSNYKADNPEPVQEPYSLWTKYTENSIRSRRHQYETPQKGPRFSLLLPTYNTRPNHLKECIDSILNQTYNAWELCIVDDCSTNPETLQSLERIASLDPRIKVSLRTTNGHICNATNDALAMATSEWICFVDHDDLLADDALQIFANAITTSPRLKLLYSDEDFLSITGDRISPHFKSDWNRDLLFAHNYITHLVCAQTERARQIGGLRIGTEGAQDYDFLLRYTHDLRDTEIKHIPEILYHWRISETSTAGSSGAKPYTIASGEKALVDLLSTNDNSLSVRCLERDNFYEVRRRVMDPTANMVSIIIPTRNCYSLLKTCVESILSKTTYPNYEIIIVDNGSDDIDTLGYLQSFNGRSGAYSRVRVLKFNEPFNYSRINNFAFSHSRGSILCLLNNDTEVIEPEWLETMAAHALRPDIGCVGAKLLYDDNTIQHAGIILSLGGFAGHSHKGLPDSSFGYFMRPHLTQEVSGVTGACLVVRSEVYKEVGGLDETLFAVAYNDVDFCLKVKSLGLRNIYVPSAVLYHHESKSRGYEDTPEKKIRFAREQTNLLKTWGSFLKQDPFYSPNLTKDREDFSIRVN